MVGVDVNQHDVDTINRDTIYIVEPDLDNVVKRIQLTQDPYRR